MLHGKRNRGYAANRGCGKPSLATSVCCLTEEMAATMDGACAPASVREQRTKWSSETTQSLIMLWENNLRRLRGTTRNSKVYEAITAELNAGLLPDVEPFTTKQVRLKIDNLNKKYRYVQYYTLWYIWHLILAGCCWIYSELAHARTCTAVYFAFARGLILF